MASVRDVEGNIGYRKLRDLKNLLPKCWNIVVGDSLHNFSDGVAIAVAFLSCDSALGWAVVAAAMAHEIPSEIADFFVLLDGGMSVCQALLFNFISASSAFIGAVIILATSGSITEAQVGFILLFSAGVLLFVAAADILPTILEVEATLKRRVALLFVLCVGCALLGLPLLKDTHCEAHGGAHGGAHAGH